MSRAPTELQRWVTEGGPPRDTPPRVTRGLLPTASCIIIVLHDTARRTVNNNDNNTDNSVRCRRGDIWRVVKSGLIIGGRVFRRLGY